MIQNHKIQLQRKLTSINKKIDKLGSTKASLFALLMYEDMLQEKKEIEEKLTKLNNGD